MIERRHMFDQWIAELFGVSMFVHQRIPPTAVGGRFRSILKTSSLIFLWRALRAGGVFVVLL